VNDQTEAAPQTEAQEAENPLETEAEIAADYLEELLDIADLDGDIDTFIEGDRAHVSIVSESQALVGPGGEVLDALQELTRLAVMTETGDRSRLMLDVAGYRERRRKELVALATDAVREVRDSKDRVPLAPMNPFERKIVHDAVAAAGLTSESEGEEPKRHVVVLPVWYQELLQGSERHESRARGLDNEASRQRFSVCERRRKAPVKRDARGARPSSRKGRKRNDYRGRKESPPAARVQP
jgi:spoIIIJ-associated protein